MKLISTLFLMPLFLIAITAHAEYYIECPDAVAQYEYPVYQQHPPHHVKHHAVKPHKKVAHHAYHHRRHSTFHMSVYYVNPCGACSFVCVDNRPPNCGQHMSSSRRHRMSHDYVTFSSAPVPYPRYEEEYIETYDMRTADDDVMRYPDMNNQY